MSPLIDVRRLWFSYESTRSRAVLPRGDWTLKDLDLSVASNSTMGIVGESGSGKSTLVRVLCGLLPIGRGVAKFDGREITDWLTSSRLDFRRHNQLVFQNPASSFDPRMRIRRSMAEPLKAIERRAPSEDEMISMLADVGLGREMLSRYPHELSGGQLQRVAIARALSVRPRVLYADEPTSSLDVSVQAHVLNLLMELRRRFGLTLIMVSHDIAVISRICEQMIIMKDGEIAEAGDTIAILRRPQSSYTASLIEAARATSIAG